MQLQDWVNLSKYGAQFKRLNLPNGTSVPIVVVHDVDTFNRTATNLSNFKQGVVNDIPFETLPGNKKGREFNQPILYMTKSFKDVGNTPYAVLPSLAKLLNISLDEVKTLREPMTEDQIVSDIPYADIEKFSAITNSCYQAYSGNTLYAVKNPTNAQNLVEYAESLTEKQHSLFPKTNISNIPFDTLDKFGLSTAIVGRAFLNPQDAKNCGYDISELKRIHLEGEMSVLPISINSDLSINYIHNVSEVSQLAYSNYKWKDNIRLIADYNALAAVHEASRMILNTRPSAIQSAEQLNGLIENISVTLQNFNESNGVSNSHKPIKYFNKGVTTHVIKNEQGEWRYIEKDASKKIDEPLTWVNYKKALATIANYNSILSAALESKVKYGAEFDKALEKVFTNHNQFFKANTQVVENLADVKDNDRLVIHANGKKIHKQKVNEAVNTFQRDMGETLYAESVKEMLSGMRSVQNAGNIKNVVGQYVDDYTLKNTISTVSEAPSDTDIGLSILDMMSQDGGADLNREAKKQILADKPVVDVSRYMDLPKGISSAIDENHNEVGDIYKTLQHIELSQIPHYVDLKADAEAELNKLTLHLNGKVEASFEDYLKYGDDVFAQTEEQKALKLHNLIDELRESADQYSQIVDRSRIQANILHYQFNKYLSNLEQPVYGTLAFQADASGNYKPFEDATAYRTAVKLVVNAYAAKNIDGYVPRISELSANLDAFVNQHYAVTSIDPAEPATALANLNRSIESSQLFSLPNAEPVENLPILKEDQIAIHRDIAHRAHAAFKSYSNRPKSTNLDMALVAVARYAQHIKNSTGVDFNPTNNPEFNAVIKSFADYEGSLDYPASQDYRSPITGVIIGDMSKVEIIKAVADKSISALDDQDEISAILLSDYAMTSAAARLMAREMLELHTARELSADMAGRFLLNYQSSLKSSEKPSSNLYYFSVNGTTDSFKVKSAELAKVPEGAIVLNTANTLNVAMREAFVVYQAHQVASELGIEELTLSAIHNIATHLQDGSHDKVAELTKDAFGHKLTANDLNSLKFVGPVDKYDHLGNRLVLIEADDVGQLHLTHDDSQKLVDRIGLTLKLADIPSDLRVNPLIKGVGDTVEFENVQKYLMPELEEHGKINALIESAEPEQLNKTLPLMMSEYAAKAWNSTMSQGYTEDKVALITNTANNEGDIVFSRVVPESWTANFAKAKGIDFNITTIREYDGQISKEMLENYALSHIQYGEYPVRPSAPVLQQATFDAVEPNTLEHSVMHKGAAITGSTVSDIENFEKKYAAINIQLAINNMPQGLTDDIRNAINGQGNLRDIEVRVSMTPQDGSSLPQLHFDSFNTSFSEDQKFMCKLDGYDIQQFLDKGDFKPAEFGNFPAVIAPNDMATSLNNMMLGRIGFDMQGYFDAVKQEAGFAELKIENPESKIDALAPVTFEESRLCKNLINDNAALFKNILIADAEKNSEHEIDAANLINSAKVFIKAHNDQVTMALAYSEAKCKELIAESFTAVTAEYQPVHRPAVGYNILQKLSKPVIDADDLENASRHLDRIFNIVDQQNSVAVDPLDNTQKIDSVVERQSEIDIEPLHGQVLAATVQELTALDNPIPVKAETVYAEKLNGFTFAEVEKMRSSELVEKVTLKNMWPKADLTVHIKSQHQNLDTLLLARALRDSITVEQPQLKEGTSLEKSALEYSFFLSEMHGAISKSKTPEELLTRFDKAYTNMTSMQPEFFSKVPGENDRNKQCEAFNAFKKASHAFVNNGVTAEDALKLVALENNHFMSTYHDVAFELGEKEQLYVGEKPFVHYMNGFTLNAQGAALDSLNNIIAARMDEVRQSSLVDLSGHETSKTVVHRDIVNTLDAKSPIDFNLKDNTADLQQKWGVEFTVDSRSKHYAQGYVALANGVLEKIHSNMPSQTTMDQVGRGLKIHGGIPQDMNHYKDLHLVDIAGGIDGNYNHFANRYTHQLVHGIEEAEIKRMTPSELSQFSGVKEEFKGLVAMSQKFDYEPKTEAAKALIATHDALVAGVEPTGLASGTKALIEHSELQVSNKLREVERNVAKFEADHTGVYAKHYVSYMESRQDAALKTMAEKMRKMQSANPNAVDMYHFVPAVDMLEKISNTATITGKSAVDKFIGDFLKENPSKNKESVSLMLQTALAEKPDSILQAQDYLASRAADKFIKLLDEYAPESIKGSEKFIENVNQYFGSKLGENIQFEQMKYASEFGHAQELEHKNALISDPDFTPAEINADKIVYNYLVAALADDEKNHHINASEKENALNMYAEVLVAHDKDRKISYVAEIRNTKELERKSEVEYDQ